MGNILVRTYGNIELQAPYELTSLLELKIEKKINDHVRIYFSGIISEENKEKYIAISDLQYNIEVNEKSTGSNFFRGTIINVEIEAVRNVYMLKVEGRSHTYEMDITLKNRSFQKKDMLYSELVKKIAHEYTGGDTIDTASNDEKLSKTNIQYNETDWEFLKRMASHFNTGLVVEPTAKTPKFWFGIPEGSERGELNNFNYTIRKNVSSYKYFSKNCDATIAENEFIQYSIESTERFMIGDKVNFKQQQLIVCEATETIEQGITKYEYILTSKKGLIQKLILNDKLSGAAVEGKVIDVQGTNVKVHLDMDEEQNKAEAAWLPYSTVYGSENNTGWYCMPELGDHVKFYFPSNKEEEGFIMNSIRRKDKPFDKINEPSTKYLRTKSGKELMFSKDELRVTGKDNQLLIRLNEAGEIEIKSDSDININAGDSFEMSSGEIDIEAENQLDITCNDSYIGMNGLTNVTASVVKM